MISFCGKGNKVYILIKVFEEEEDYKYKVEVYKFNNMYYIPEKSEYKENCTFEEILNKINKIFLNNGINEYESSRY